MGIEGPPRSLGCRGLEQDCLPGAERIGLAPVMSANESPQGVPAPRRLAAWLSALPDLAAFAGGLGMAWVFGWNTRDLVWSLWLSSLLVGYSIILWRIFGPAVVDFLRGPGKGQAAGIGAAIMGMRIFGGLFVAAFFTVHFGMFHYIHSTFLNQFFPVLDVKARGFPAREVYAHVLKAYWPFVIVAAIAERAAFSKPTIAGTGGGFGEAYKNVVRMHVLIFFFFFAHFAKLESLWVYAVVYAVYFFPWRLVRRAPQATPGQPARADLGA